MLRERVNTDDDMGAPLLERIPDVPDAPSMEELAGFGPEAVDRPVQVFHPALLVTQKPVVHIDELLCYVVRLFDSSYGPDRYRLTEPELLDPDGQRLGGRTMPAAGVGGYDQDLWRIL